MPDPTRAQLVLVEVAAAAVLGGFALGGGWRLAGVAIGAVIALAAIVPVRSRWVYQVAGSWVRFVRRRRRGRRGAGLTGLLGEYHVESVPAGTRGGSIGVVRCGTTWCLPLALGLDSIFNDDPPVPIRLLTDLLRVEDVRLSSVRLFTLTTPARVAARAPGGPAAPLTPLVARYCLITLDGRRAADAIAARGGSQAAVHQILRRCAVHAEQVLSTAGLTVRRLDHAAVASLFATWLGPASEADGSSPPPAAERWRDIEVAGTWSTIFAVTGRGDDVADRVSRLTAAAPTPVAATVLVLRSSDRHGETGDEVTGTILIRLSAPSAGSHEDTAHSLGLLARAFDLEMQRGDGEQAELLRATTPIGIGEPA
ncbi:MAG TPA: type VII secretion protein EccE [Jatrophihabitans sp.]|nr:type VII secretion protein EccE [Jatrophihabitans sp.]